MMNTMAYQDPRAARAAALMQVGQLDFAVVDATLYLDTHPADTAALSYRNQVQEAGRRAREAYEQQFGPLTSSSSSDGAYWSWVEDPWPWEGGQS